MPTDPMSREDVHVGLTVMQTVYTVAMVLGFKNALEKSYSVFISPFEAPPGKLPHLVLLLALIAVMLLGLRFFWVVRNLYEFVLTPTSNIRRRLRATAILHFPITLVHALLFFAICQAYAEIVTTNATVTSALAVDLVARFVFLFAGLLFLNGAWLLATFRPDWSQPEGIWGYSNVLFAALGALNVWVVLDLIRASPTALAISACALFIVNSVIDLWFAGDSYIQFPQGARPATCRWPGAPAPPDPPQIPAGGSPSGTS
jgi:hypothetical protein